MLCRMSELLVVVDWERQSEEMILVKYQIGDHADSTGFIVGRPLGDNCDDERKKLTEAMEAARFVLDQTSEPTMFKGRMIAEGKKLFRLIITENAPPLASMARAIWGSPQSPVHADAVADDEIAGAVIRCAHALIEAKLDPHEDTAA